MSKTKKGADAPSVAPKKFQFDFSSTNDLFISTKGRELRNRYKKMDKILNFEKQMAEDTAATATLKDEQKQMIAQKPQLQKEIADLQDLIDLYVKSNPNYDKTPVAVAPKEVVKTEVIEKTVFIHDEAITKAHLELLLWYTHSK